MSCSSQVATYWSDDHTRAFSLLVGLAWPAALQYKRATITFNLQMSLNVAKKGESMLSYGGNSTASGSRFVFYFASACCQE